ncbi:D-2-hydroxyacid dehydrogenase family protein [Dactylosporangium fulvum]|uniref:D-2-hydroxyacid dehydrogenase family protein n=1 Tax=Dactylosporangium fulvum TaxID=53359 RepID=A0ABY5WBF6_9ACTN|nr:D-2-hydroxyacid dehydrogenase family protein [Dactylosporangium fulvum]UWP86720.1 D-2-hydroxyacid dehydrogenase family protein [Dactylosporangium fulvum]
MPIRIAVLDDYQSAAQSSADWTPLRDRADVTFFTDHVADPADLVRRLESFEVVVAMRERTAFPASILDRLPNLALLVTTGPFNAAIDVAAAHARGIVVCGTGSVPHTTAELTWALIMAVTRRVAAEDAALRAGRWQTTIGPELAGSTLGILGLGNIGARIARYAQAFDMDVVAWSENLTSERAEAVGVKLVSKQELFERADVATVHLKLSERTTNLIGRPELELLGPRGYLVNTSRGPIVDEYALAAALSEGVIAGAALDVFSVEPLPADHPLRLAPNTVLTPHIGYVSEPMYQRFFGDAVEDIVSWLQGTPVRVISAG